MKITFYFWLNIVILGVVFEALGADSDLLNRITVDRRDSAILENLESGVMPADAAESHSLPMKPVSAFGAVFSGEVVFKEGVRDRIAMWTHDPLMKPRDGIELFGEMSSALKRKFGAGKVVDDIPNYGDGSEVKSSASLWFLQDEVVVLRLDQYSSRAGIILVRQEAKSWRANMGADESVFWSQTSDRKSEPQRQSESLRQQSPSRIVNEPFPPGSEPEIADHMEMSPVETGGPSEGRDAFFWLLILGIIVVLGVAVIVIRAFMRGRAS